MRDAIAHTPVISVLFWTIFFYNFFVGLHRTDIPAQASSKYTLT